MLISCSQNELPGLYLGFCCFLDLLNVPHTSLVFTWTVYVVGSAKEAKKPEVAPSSEDTGVLHGVLLHVEPTPSSRLFYHHWICFVFSVLEADPHPFSPENGSMTTNFVVVHQFCPYQGWYYLILSGRPAKTKEIEINSRRSRQKLNNSSEKTTLEIP